MRYFLYPFREVTLAGAGRALHELEPREQAGARTGALYDYQYHQAAVEALSLLDDQDLVCVYCEWHDDYVCEAASSGSYRFHQVKTRSKSQGPWKLSEFFGLPRKKPDPAKADSVFAHLWDHFQKFGDRCVAFVFVTDAGIASDLERLVLESRQATQASDLSADIQSAFSRIRDACSLSLQGISDTSLLTFLSRLQARDAIGAVRDLPGCRVLMAKYIRDVSEVDLKISEAEKIGSDLVATIRQRSHRTLATLPSTVADLRAAKGVMVENVLQILSLSTEGYRELRTAGRESVRTLSRLHRLCKRNGVPETLIRDMCRFKTGWDAWWLEQRHRVEQLDHLALKNECAKVLRAHSDAGLSFGEMIDQARGIADRFRNTLTSSEPLTGELVLGFIIALAVEAEA